MKQILSVLVDNLLPLMQKMSLALETALETVAFLLHLSDSD